MNCEVDIRGNSLHFNPPSGRAYYGPVGELNLVPCETCDGEGHHDSCFDCGNRGWNEADVSRGNCGICGEWYDTNDHRPSVSHVAEYVLADGEHVIAHAECGLNKEGVVLA